jgi:hypothetical protein
VHEIAAGIAYEALRRRGGVCGLVSRLRNRAEMREMPSNLNRQYEYLIASAPEPSKKGARAMRDEIEMYEPRNINFMKRRCDCARNLMIAQRRSSLGYEQEAIR